MRSMTFTPPTEEEKQMYKRLDAMNHAPYFEIFLLLAGGFCAFTVLVLIGIF